MAAYLKLFSICFVCTILVGCVPKPAEDGTVKKEGPQETYSASALPEGWSFDLSEMSGRKTQEEIAAGEHISISGEIKGECSGTIRVDLIQPGGDPNDPEAADRPLSTIDLQAAGPFSLLAPTDTKLALGAECDGDGDGVIKSEADGMCFPVEVGKLWADYEGVVLELGKVGRKLTSPMPAGGELPPDKSLEGNPPAKGEPPVGQPQGPPPSQPQGPPPGPPVKDEGHPDKGQPKPDQPAKK